MTEAFLHYVWRTRRFHLAKLFTSRGQPIRILDFGQYNTDSGPDFKHARIRIGGTLWAGHVEMHLLASDWMKHRHQDDPAYDNVILHVVLADDRAIHNRNGMRIPCLVLKPYIHQKVQANYERLQYQEPWVPCQRHLADIPKLKVHAWIDRMLAERMAAGGSRLKQVLDTTKNHWEEAFYICLARSFGLYQNREAFAELSKRIPLNLIRKHRDQPLQVEALLFGGSGLLPGNSRDDYVRQLEREFRFLSRKYSLQPLNPVRWQFFRMRPINFPTIRIAQFASLVRSCDHLLQTCLDIPDARALNQWFRSVATAPFWDSHYHFHKESPERPKKIGDTFARLLIINTIAPFLYLYGMERNQRKWVDQALNWLQDLPPERHQLTRKWKEAGITAEHAGHTQGLIHLKRMYCDNKACLECGIGHQVLSLSVDGKTE